MSSEAVVDEIKGNYHSYLEDITSIDPIIKKMREQNGKAWRGKAWKGPFTQIGHNAKHLKVFSAIKWFSLPLIGPLVGVLAGWFSTLALWLIIVAGIVLSFVAYIILVKIYEGRMAIIGDPRFHVEALKVKRSDEYEKIWSHFVEKKDFTFNGLAGFVDAVFKGSGDNGHIDRVVVFAEGQIEEINRARDELKQTIESQEEAISSMELELQKSENAVGHLVGLLKKVNENLYRLVNEKLELHDLDFVTGFSLYRKVDNQLHMILNKGTTGASRDPLDLENPGRPYAAVDAANSETDEAFSNTPFPGRNVVAFRMKMLNDETWVWCFHYDEDDERALSLTKSNDIIESRQIRRMIHVFCLILQKRMLASREVDQSASSK